MSGKLILVATPIGNLDDISIRALKTLRECDFIAAEDTRVSMKLLNHFEIKKSLISYHEHNMKDKGNLIISKILAGNVCVLVTDAGMPAISDPGEQIVKLCHNNGIAVSVIPGPCAAVSALAVSGMDTSEFVFIGFLSSERKEKYRKLESLKSEKRTMVIYESPHRLLKTLTALYDILGIRSITLVKELTKIHEEIIKTDTKKALDLYDDDNKPRGEYVLVLEGNKENSGKKYTLKQACELAVSLVEEGESILSASKKAAKLSGIGKRNIYNEIIKSKQ